MFKYTSSPVAESWIALLFTILSFALRAGDEYDPMLDKFSIEYESRAWNCLTQGNNILKHSLQGLKVILLLSYLKAHRGLPIYSLARMALEISHRIHVPEPAEQQIISNGLGTIFSLCFQLSEVPNEQCIQEIIKFQLEGSPALAIGHAELDEVSSRISEFVHFGYEYAIEQLEGRLQLIQSSLEGKTHIDGVNSAILECRLHYLSHYLLRKKCILPGSPMKNKCIQSARKVLTIFCQLIWEESQPMWWYLYGLGSFYASDCA